MTSEPEAGQVWEQPRFKGYAQGGPVTKGVPMIFDSEAGCLVPMLYVARTKDLPPETLEADEVLDTD